ncbi:MAG: hypothetical protein JWQ66_1779 [Mucilaginibacter sp.]|nr:hypothetical protein [Mucilaginibacter sp.]
MDPAPEQAHIINYPPILNQLVPVYSYLLAFILTRKDMGPACRRKVHFIRRVAVQVPEQ